MQSYLAVQLGMTKSTMLGQGGAHLTSTNLRGIHPLARTARLDLTFIGARFRYSSCAQRAKGSVYGLCSATTRDTAESQAHLDAQE